MQLWVSLLLCIVATALALPAIPGILKVDLDVRARDSEWYRAVQYTDKDSPRGNNITYIQVAVSISRKNSADLSNSVDIQWVFNWYKRDWADFSTTPGTCISLNRADLQYVGGPTFQYGNVQLIGNQESVDLDLESGPYYITFYNCDPSVDINVKGTMYFRNPFGWLNGEDWPSAALYGLFMTLYIIFSIIFGVFLWRNREFSHPFQIMIIALLVVSWIYLGIGFIIYMNINSRGRISTGVLAVEAIISACRETFIRLLLLCISLGYHVIFPVIGGTCFKLTIIIYASLYWLFTFIVTLLDAILVNTTNSVNTGGYTFAAVIQVILELIWWFWIFYNTVVVSRILQAGGANYIDKYRIYRALFWMMIILGIYVIISYVVFVIGAYRDKLDSWWHSWWYFDFYGEFAFFAVMLVLMSSWRPGRDPRKYSYQPLVLGSPQGPAPVPAATAAPPSSGPATAVPVTASASPAQQPASYASL